MDSPSDPIPAANKSLNVGVLVPNEKRVGLKNLHIVDPPPGTTYGTKLSFFSVSGKKSTVRIPPSSVKDWKIGMILPKTHAAVIDGKVAGRAKRARGAAAAAAAVNSQGWQSSAPSRALLKTLDESFGKELKEYDVSKVYNLSDPAKGAAIQNFAASKSGTTVLLILTAPEKLQEPATFHIVQEEDGHIVGGNTFVLRARKPS
jgi:hypothetical protein